MNKKDFEIIFDKYKGKKGIEDIDFSINAMIAIIWQFEEAEKLISIIKNKQEWLNKDVREFWENWYRDVFNPETCNEFGVRVWSIILDIYTGTGTKRSEKDVFGFGKIHGGFGYNFGVGGTGWDYLSLEQKRQVIKIRYLYLTSSANVKSFNTGLKIIFGDDVYVRETGEVMEIEVIFEREIKSIEIAIIRNFLMLPRPQGVRINILSIRVDINHFGFGGNNENFGINGEKKSNFAKRAILTKKRNEDEKREREK